MLTKDDYQKYIDVLKEELIPAMGCTEPISIAYAAALARKYMEVLPDRVEVCVSGNIVKNVKSVIVPNTNGMRGIETAAAAGIIAGDSDKKLKVIAKVPDEKINAIKDFLNQVPITVKLADSDKIFDIVVRLNCGDENASVRICDYHTNVVEIRKNNRVVFEKGAQLSDIHEMTDRSFMNIADIIEFADTVDISQVKGLLSQQIQCNMAIANEGLNGNYGANIGKILLHMYGSDDVKIRAKAKAAAASDARMNGCEMPVVINSGSGNQGLTASVPVIEYANTMNVGEEMTYRALLVSNLVTIHLKSSIGRLSAYCGAVSAGCGGGAGIAYLHGGKEKEISHTVVNAVAITSGMICDGAKASCAAKIAAAVDAGILGFFMYKEGQQFYGGDGIVKKGIEKTIKSVGQLARDGMAGTDKEIIRIMIEDE